MANSRGPDSKRWEDVLYFIDPTHIADIAGVPAPTVTLSNA